MKVLLTVLIGLILYSGYIINAESNMPEPYVLKTGTVIESGCTNVTVKYPAIDCRARIKFENEIVTTSLRFSVLKGDSIDYMKQDKFIIKYSKDHKAIYFYRLNEGKI